ncbi:asparagine synthase-related protein [uncultured Microscilla sp.]|uniref:asparagine synthetase B family protein n=1 Tax=uncultured Microscilla sp. TaxID=432653 RepID=UPI00263914A0|nr:asparagine synthase-related protein [uncultured Microscilla sp.]
MSVIFGCTHAQINDLPHMFAQVKHRGSHEYQSATAPKSQLSIGFSIPAHEHIHRYSSGIAQNKDILLAASGNITNQGFEPLSPQGLLELYANQGIDFLKGIRGAYTLVIINNEDIYIARDGTGQRTIFYTTQQNRLAFCNEAKGIYALPHFNKQLNLAAIPIYFTFSFLPLQTTMMQDVYELPAGMYLHYHPRQGAQTHRFFELEAFAKTQKQSTEYWIDRIRKEVDREIEAKMANEKEIGVFLSGGLDSSILAARVAQLSPSKIHTYSIHFGKKYRNELHYAQKVAQRYQTQHHEVEIKPKNFVPQLRQAIWHLDDPVGDPITIPNFELARFASQTTRVVFNGEGGDPCFGGPKNIPMLLNHWYGGIEHPPYFREKAYLASYRRGYAYLKQILAPRLLEGFDEDQHLVPILTPFFECKHQNFLDKLMTINMRLKGAHLILPKVERMLGAVGVTPVSPLFTSEIAQSSIEMPSQLKLQQGIEKYILKQAYANELPPEIIRRPKSGMRVPLHYWFQGEMKKYAKKMLSAKSIRRSQLFNPATVKTILNYNKDTGIHRHGLLIWMMLTLEIWQRLFIEGEDL